MVVELASGFAVVGAGAWLFGRAQPAAVRGTLRVRGLKGFVCPDRGALTRGELAESGSTAVRKAAPPPFEGASGAVGKPPAAAFEGSLRSPLKDASGIAPAEEAPERGRSPLPTPAQPASDVRAADLERGEAASNGGPPESRAKAWLSAADRPFLTRIDCGAPVSAVSDKVLVAPAAARSGARLVKVVPMSLARSLRTTEFSSEWVVMATRSRTTRIALADGESLGVRPEAAVAWTGARPTGFCPRLRLLDVLLPRGPRDLLLHFHGPAIVWVEGSENLPLRRGAPGKAVF